MEVIHPNTALGTVALTVSDLERSTAFYTSVLGFKVHQQNGDTIHLGAGKQDLLILTEVPEAKLAQPQRGLYHYAILVPSRFELAQSIWRIAETRLPVQGFADHFVSEAMYLADPDGIGIEIYRDLPRDQWTYLNGEMQIGTESLDIDNVLGTLGATPPPWDGLHPDTVMGHMHLHVDNMEKAEHFYEEVLGFERVTKIGNFMTFVSAGGYHHHIGMRPGVGPQQTNAAGLRWYSIILPDQSALDWVIDRLRAADIPLNDHAGSVQLHDPALNGIRLHLP